MIELMFLSALVGVLAYAANKRIAPSGQPNKSALTIDESEAVPDHIVLNDNVLNGAHLPRGIRNNNAGNIRISASPWQGKVPVAQNTDGAFEQFTSAKYGLRALMKLLLTYERQGFNTIEKIVSKYAPANENKTHLYSAFVARELGKTEREIIDVRANLIPLARAIVTYENGIQYANYYSNTLYDEASLMV